MEDGAVKPLVWAAIGAGVALATGLLFFKESTEMRPSPPPPPKAYGEPVRIALPVPSGWRRATNADVTALPELSVAANSLMNTPGFTAMPYGTLAPFVASNGLTYATWIEQHFHPPGGVAQPWGLHHGVTILAQSGQIT